jgi:chitin disaccharide deacetylase
MYRNGPVPYCRTIVPKTGFHIRRIVLYGAAKLILGILMRSFRNVVLCADDFGLSDGVSRGIVELAEIGRLSATGAMTNMPGCRRMASALRPLKGRIGIGLHLNLTTGSPLGAMPRLAPSGAFPPLKELLAGALRRKLPAYEIREEIARQLDAFTGMHGEPPAFVDGHQHVHVLPVIRQALLQVLKERGYALAKSFARDAHAAGFQTNTGFSGFAPFDLSIPVARIFEEAVSGLGASPLIMCHPGYVDEELRGLDPAVESREEELRYLKSDVFGELLEERRIRLVSGP